MHRVSLASGTERDGWRRATRRLIAAGVAPEAVEWVPGSAEAIAPPLPPDDAPARFTLPRALAELIDPVLAASDPARFALLYRLVWRVHAGARTLLVETGDADVQRALMLARPALVVAYQQAIAAAEDQHKAAMEQARSCRLCPLFGPATQTVFGEGPDGASMMLVGEQPGDQEDLAGRPFVGPAGQMLDRALIEAGVDRTRVYVTNAVKHFKFEPRGKRRIHQKPDSGDIAACRFWLDLERAQMRPDLLVLMGATAAQSVLKRSVTIGRERGRRIDLAEGGAAFVTVHPSYLLRLPDEAAKAQEYTSFVQDLRAAGQLAAEIAAAKPRRIPAADQLFSPAADGSPT